MQRFKPKRRLKKMAIIKFILAIIFLFLTFKFISNMLVTNSSIILKSVIDNNFTNNNSNIFSKVYDYTSNNFINNPKNILMFSSKDESKKDLINNELKKEESVEKVEETVKNDDNASIKIYIYSTHQKEEYKKDYMEDYNVVPGVYLASLLIQEKLNDINVKTEVMKDDITAYLNKNNLDYSRSYDASRYYLKPIVENNKDIKLFIDLHRDAAPKSVTTTIIDDKSYARVMFVIGQEYNTYKENLQVANRINDKIKNLYPNLTRGVLQKSGYGVNGVYNQDLKNNIILIELGGNENNIEEVSNTVDILVKILGEYVNEN